MAWELAALAAPSFYVPTVTLLRHYGYVTRDYRLILIGLVGFISGLLLAWIFRRLGFRRRVSFHSAAIALVWINLGGSIGPDLPGGYAMASVLALFSVVCVLGLGHWKLIDLTVVWIVILLWVWIGAALVGSVMERSPSRLAASEPVVPAFPASTKGDVVVVLFDGYPSLAFAAHQLGIDTAELVDSLESGGFDVHASVAANYPFTELSLPSFLDMRLLLSEGERTNENTRKDLLSIIGGDSALVKGLKHVGYRVTIVESGWSGLRCGALVDQCGVRSFYDEPVASVLASSLAYPWVTSMWGSPFTVGADRNIAWLDRNLAEITGDQTDDFVFVHIMLPHPPITRDSDCSRARTIGTKQDALAGQVRCASRLVAMVARESHEARLVVILGDHGTSSTGAIETDPNKWTKAMLSERMNTMAAVRGWEGCAERQARTLVNIFVRAARCLGAINVQWSPDASFVTSVRGEPLVKVSR